jgi:hypothetical protein
VHFLVVLHVSGVAIGNGTTVPMLSDGLLHGGLYVCELLCVQIQGRELRAPPRPASDLRYNCSRRSMFFESVSILAKDLCSSNAPAAFC